MDDLDSYDSSLEPIEKMYKSPTTYSIEQDMDGTDVPSYIRMDANNIYQHIRETCGTKRSKKRRQLVFFCIYKAYLNKGIKIDPETLADKIFIKDKLTKKDISKAIVEYNDGTLDTNYDVSELLPFYRNELGLPEETSKALDDILRLVKNSNLIGKFLPQYIVAGMIFYYIRTRGYQIANEMFLKTFHINRINSVVDISNEVAKLDNR